jgi:hypothetical protein
MKDVIKGTLKNSLYILRVIAIVIFWLGWIYSLTTIAVLGTCLLFFGFEWSEVDLIIMGGMLVYSLIGFSYISYDNGWFK